MSQLQTQSDSQPAKKKTTISLDGFKIDAKISEYENESHFFELKIDSMLFDFQSNNDKTIIDKNLIATYLDLLEKVYSKLNKWKEIKALYSLNITISFMNNEYSLHELELEYVHKQKLSSKLNEATELIASNKLPSGASIQLHEIYSLYKNSSKKSQYYLSAINMAKAKTVQFEVDSSLIDD